MISHFMLMMKDDTGGLDNAHLYHIIFIYVIQFKTGRYSQYW